MNILVASIVLTASYVVTTAEVAAQSRGQQQVGTRFRDTGSQVDPDKARQMQKRVAGCVYGRNKDEAENLLRKSDFYRADFVELEYEPEELFDQFEVNGCIERVMRTGTYRMEMRVSYSTLRNLLAEEAYLKSNKDPVKIPQGAPELLPNRYVGYQRDPRTDFMANLADCVVYRATKDAHELLDSRPGSGGEKKRVEKLQPVFEACLKGEEAPQIEVSLMRQILADGLWSRAYYGPRIEMAAISKGSSTQGGQD